MKRQLLFAYVTTAKYLRERLPFSNSLLRHLLSLSPDLRNHTLGKQYLLHLALDYIHILDDGEKGQIEKELCSYCINPASSIDSATRIDHYWFRLRREYPLLSKLALIYIGIMSAPEVERSFSRMTSSLTEKTSQMKVETLDAIQSMKQYLLVHKQSSLEKFKRRCVVHDPVPSNLVKKMLNASKKRKESLENEKDRKSEFLRRLSIKPQKRCRKSTIRQVAIQAAEKARRKHRKHALKVLAENLKKKNLTCRMKGNNEGRIITKDKKMTEKKRHRSDDISDSAKPRTKKNRTLQESAPPTTTTTVLGSQSDSSTPIIEEKQKSTSSSMFKKKVKQTSINSLFK